MESRSTSLADLVRSYLDDREVALRPLDPVEEVRANTWAFTVRGVHVDPAETAAALEDVAAELRRRHADQPGRATFYAWYDGQAGELRCSLSSAAPDSLPFGARYDWSAERLMAEKVVQLAGADLHPGVIHMDEMTPADWDVEAPVDHAPLLVWATVVR